MGRYIVETKIDAPPERVFEVAADFENAPGRIESILSLDILTEGPVGKGTRFRETRKMMGREATEEMEIVDFVPGKSYRVDCEACGTLWSSDFDFVPEDGGTMLRLVMTSKPQTFMARLMTPVGWLFVGTMKKAMAKDMADVKKFAEG